MRFRNIDPNKEGKNILTASDLKHEIQIITLQNFIFKKFKDFLELHTHGNIIDPDTGDFVYKIKSSFEHRKHLVNREFLRKLGRLSDEDISEMVSLLTDVDTAPGAPRYPKLSFHKTKHYHRSQQSVGDWCIPRKSKYIAWQELKAADSNLPFFKPHEEKVNKEMWKLWKKAKGFSSASWNMLLSHIDTKFYSARMQNLGKLKTAKELQDKFPNVENFFKKFLSLKTAPVNTFPKFYLGLRTSTTTP